MPSAIEFIYKGRRSSTVINSSSSHMNLNYANLCMYMNVRVIFKYKSIEKQKISNDKALFAVMTMMHGKLTFCCGVGLRSAPGITQIWPYILPSLFSLSSSCRSFSCRIFTCSSLCVSTVSSRALRTRASCSSLARHSRSTWTCQFCFYM